MSIDCKGVLMKHVEIIKIMMLVFCFISSNSVFSYNDNDFYCFTCEENNRCAECYGYEEEEKKDNSANTCACQKINDYTGRLSKKRAKDYSQWPGDKTLDNSTR